MRNVLCRKRYLSLALHNIPELPMHSKGVLHHCVDFLLELPEGFFSGIGQAAKPCIQPKSKKLSSPFSALPESKAPSTYLLSVVSGLGLGASEHVGLEHGRRLRFKGLGLSDLFAA